MIAFPIEQKEQELKLNERFGRAKFFYLTDGQDGRIVENPYLNEARGVGIKVAQWLVNQGVKIVFVKNIGINALSVLSQAQVKIFKAKVEDVKENLNLFNQGLYKEPLSIPDTTSRGLSNCQAGNKRCVCVSCGYIFAGQPGVPCRQITCPKCGSRVRRLP